MTAVSARRAALSVYAPSAVWGVGQGAIAPVVALSARELGASVGVAALVVALVGLGGLVGDLPAGALAHRVGERRAMLWSTAVAALALVGCVLASSVAVLGVSVAALGAAGAVWGLARQAYLTEAVPVAMRARALSTLGGTHRIGFFVGPFVGAWAIGVWGLDGAYGVHAVASALACLVLLAVREVEHPAVEASADTPATGSTLWGVVRAHLPVLRTLGLSVVVLTAVRASRQVVLPLWAQHRGLDATTTSVVFGVSGAVDMLLFYPAGLVMDRFGRRWVAVPSTVLLGLAHLLLPLTTGVTGLVAVALLLGVANGMGSGIVMTLGADASPDVGRAQFLGAWRLCADAGTAGGPFVISAVTAVAPLGVAIAVMGAVGVLGAMALHRYTGAVDPTRTWSQNR
ncbi:MFS transporter [Angustibacter peucedani]